MNNNKFKINLAFIILLVIINAVRVMGQGEFRQRRTARPETPSAAVETPSPAAFVRTVRGEVVDADAQIPLPGVRVVVAEIDGLGALTDAAGRFVIENIPVGRRTFVASLPGYEDALVAAVAVTTGKDPALSIRMREKIVELEAVKIEDERRRDQALNELATVSARSFTVEETGRYAGSLNDPARMASNFAGVATAGDTRNDIIVRGNSPLALLWRLEGVDIPNPNHFATSGANGGPISILNNNTLANSDFMTGAFPAEYSNATAAAFDLKMRNGNAAKYEHSFQIGFNGVELMTEGPISKKLGASYLASYRYSTLALFNAVGIKFGDLEGIPKFMDGSLKIFVPTPKVGTFSLFAVGGNSDYTFYESKISDESWNNNDRLTYQDVSAKAGMAAVGVSHAFILDEKSSIKTTVAWSGVMRNIRNDSLSVNREDPFHVIPVYRERATDSKITLASVYNRKINARHTIRAGTFVERLGFTVADSTLFRYPSEFRTLRDEQGGTFMARLYGQWQYRPVDKITFNAGMNAMYLAVGESFAAEPRVGVQYAPAPKHRLSLAYGMHHQSQPLYLYLNRDEENRQTNKNLKFTRSQHVVAGYDWSIGGDYRLKTEAYFQYLDHIPVRNFSSPYSAVNSGVGFGSVPGLTNLVSNGTAQNYGLELTFEKFFSKNYYVLVTGSLFESSYTASDGKRYRTAFANNYIANALAGAELPVGKKNGKGNALFGDVRFTLAGGRPLTPFDMELSRLVRRGVEDESRNFAERYPVYYRLDVKAGFRWNLKKVSQEFSIFIQNVTARENVLFYFYNPNADAVVAFNQLGFFPVGQYRIQF